MFNTIKLENLHHAYLIEGDTTFVTPLLTAHLESLGIPILSNPNIRSMSYESLLVDDARDIHAKQIERSEDGGKKIFIISSQFINHQAQNALLKTFEEPTEGTHFFVIMPSIQSLYETLISRFQIIKHESIGEGSDEAKKFLSQSVTGRLEYIVSFIKAHEDDENSGGVRAHATTLVSGIEKILYRSTTDEQKRSLLLVWQDLERARGYLGTSGASVKMILEQLALVLPKM
jgi:DNA polymerase III delta prime subunit